MKLKSMIFGAILTVTSCATKQFNDNALVAESIPSLLFIDTVEISSPALIEFEEWETTHKINSGLINLDSFDFSTSTNYENFITDDGMVMLRPESFLTVMYNNRDLYNVVFDTLFEQIHDDLIDSKPHILYKYNSLDGQRTPFKNGQWKYIKLNDSKFLHFKVNGLLISTTMSIKRINPFDRYEDSLFNIYVPMFWERNSL